MRPGTSRSWARRTTRRARAADGAWATAMTAPRRPASVTPAWLRIALVLPGRMQAVAFAARRSPMRALPSALVLFRQHLLALLGRQLPLENRDLIVAGVRDIEPRGLAIKP